MSNNKNAICILTIKPHLELINFYIQFKNYDVYFVIDDLNYDCDLLRTTYPTIKFIQIPNEVCESSGFKYSSYMQSSSLTFNEIIAWDRAMYYFTNGCDCDCQYDFVWFMEDDVFIYGEETIDAVDKNYPNSDILCRDKTPESKPDEWQWFWPAIHINFERPYFQSLICVVRMSNKLLKCINEYVTSNKRMFFIEAMFPTIAHKNNLVYDTPVEMNKIVWRNDWKEEQHNITKTDFVHPVKCIDLHKEFRNKLLQPYLKKGINYCFDYEYDPVDVFGRKIYNVTDGSTVILCCYQIHHDYDNSDTKPYLQYLLKDYNGVLNFPRYKLLFNPFSVHEPHDINVDATVAMHHRNELSANKIFTIVRKCLYDVTKNKNHIIAYVGYKKYKKEIYLFTNIITGSFTNSNCKDASICLVDEMINAAPLLDGRQIDPEVTNFVVDNMASFTITYPYPCP